MRPLLAVALVAAAASTASAGPGYLGLGIGTSATPNGDLTMTSNDGNRTGRVLGGWRFGRFAVEGAASRFGINRGPAPYQGTSLAVAGKYSLSLGDNFEAFGRAGLQRTWLSADSDTILGYVGNGWLLGAGFEYRFDVAATPASVFVDYQHSQTDLERDKDMRHVGEGFGMWTIGATVSL